MKSKFKENNVTKWLLCVAMLSTLCWAQSIMQDQNTNTWGKSGQATGTTANFPDIKGTLTEKFEVVVNGTAPASLTVTVTGCMRGGTCSSTLATSSGTASQLLSPASSDIFDFYQVTTSWTGGDATTQFVVNRTGTVARKSGGSGSGTVSANNTAAGAVANYAAAGGSTTVGPTTLNYVAPTLTVSTAGGGNGALALSGTTSGTATLTAPAVAGTSTNGITSSNVFLVPDGTTSLPAYSFSSEPATGFFKPASGQVDLSTNNSIEFRWLNPQYIQAFNVLMGWSSSNAGASIDTNLSRLAAGIVQVNTTAANRQGLLVSGDSVFVASNFTTAANTNLQTITGLSWTVPAVAVNLNFHCHGAYSQATAAAAVAFGIQAATNAPTNIFATGIEQITVGPPATLVTGTLATLTTTTATAVVSGTPGAQATNYTWELFGTIENPASANTFNVMVSTATSGDAVTVLRGSYCSITP